MAGADTQAFEYFRVKTAPVLSGHFSTGVWEHLVLQLSQRHPLVLHASVAVGSLYHFRQSGPGCLAASKAAKSHYDLALTSYGKAVGGLRSYIEKTTKEVDEEVTLVVLVSCLLFVCFEMLQGDQRLVISHLVKGMKILFSQYKSSPGCITATMRPVILGNDFPDTMDSLADVFVRLDADSTMFGRRSTYLCTSCRCCCQGSEIKIHHSFNSVKEARSHLDLLTSNAFRLRGNLLKLVERLVAPSSDFELWIDNVGSEDWARRYCNLYAQARTIDLKGSTGGAELLAKQDELISAFEAWNSGLTTLREKSDDLSLMMLRIQHFFSWFVVSTLRDRTETVCDRYHAEYAEVVDLAKQYVERTNQTADLCGFSLESGILRSLYVVGLKCRDSRIRRQAVELLRDSPVQEGLWSGKVFAAYVQRVIDVEEAQARQLRPDIPERQALTYNTVPESSRMRDVVLATDDTRPLFARMVCSQSTSEDGLTMRFMEDKFQLLSV